jgi:hypothetical protein
LARQVSRSYDDVVKRIERMGLNNHGFLLTERSETIEGKNLPCYKYQRKRQNSEIPFYIRQSEGKNKGGKSKGGAKSQSQLSVPGGVVGKAGKEKPSVKKGLVNPSQVSVCIVR